ncbi:halocarboxylic acid dehydrogenase DehI family protein [Pelagibius sp. Alg239-R121]|uniref:halocarboxylic acid dehydrogenase DehI family protein n=1 Tax=Pelagibius sp. Alg239-R121 TaxID=2993448 RepID=UPI0024A759BD|nr:halocarboxylic acid dehydrogenase DehI family protein [Pelagibius sp. Alg239-R121]
MRRRRVICSLRNGLARIHRYPAGMIDLARKKPNPIPAIHPLPEYLARGPRKAVYEDTKAVLQVPWMGVVTMAFSHYPTFYDCLWSGVRPLCQNRAFLEACKGLRTFTEQQVANFDLNGLRGALGTRGFAEQECADIGDVIEVFAVGNFPYLLIATIARLLLQDGTLSGVPTVVAANIEERGGAAVQRLVLMERHHADAQTIEVYDDIQTTLGLPFVNTDYRALARWPSYFALAWADLKSVIVTPDYEPRVESVHQEAVKLVHSLPNLGGLDTAKLKAAALNDAPDGEVEAVVQLFQWLLPGLVTNVACFQQQLDGSTSQSRV